MNIGPDELEGFTDEERAELEAIKAEGPSDFTDEGSDEAEDKAEAAKPDDKPDAEAATEEQAAEIAPPLRAHPPEDAAAKLAAIGTDEEALSTRFDEGDITAKEFRDGLNALAERREEIRWNQRKAELAGEMTKQAQDNAWESDVREFFAGPAAHIAKSRAALIAFDEHVKAVTGDAANAKLSNRAQLDKALKSFQADIGEAFSVKPQAAQEGRQEAPPRKAREVPPTLGRVPAAELESTDGGKYAALDRLATSNPEAYERAFLKLSASEREEYAASAV